MQAFEGIRVLDLTHVLAGPFSTYQLAVLGADVIKIEQVDEMDMNREIGPVDELNEAGMGAHFQSQASNKRAMTLNLKSPEGKEIFLVLAKGADVIVENFRAGALRSLGLGYEDICAINPGIIYCSLTGFGQTGPKRAHGAFDNVIQAYSGFLNATGSEDGQAYAVGPPAIDYGTGAQAAFAISSALFRRERSGEGQWIDIAMLDAALMFMTSSVLNYALVGSVPKPSGSRSGPYACYGCFEASDGLLALGAVTPRQHTRMWKALGRDDLAEEAAGLNLMDFTKLRERDEAILLDILKTRTANEWEQLFVEAGVPAARVRGLDEALTSEQVASRRVVGEIGEESLRRTVAAFACSADGPALRTPPPEHGQHTDEILASLGYGTEKIESWRQQGVI